MPSATGTAHVPAGAPDDDEDAVVVAVDEEDADPEDEMPPEELLDAFPVAALEEGAPVALVPARPDVDVIEPVAPDEVEVLASDVPTPLPDELLVAAAPEAEMFGLPVVELEDEDEDELVAAVGDWPVPEAVVTFALPEMPLVKVDTPPCGPTGARKQPDMATKATIPAYARPTSSRVSQIALSRRVPRLERLGAPFTARSLARDCCPDPRRRRSEPRRRPRRTGC